MGDDEIGVSRRDGTCTCPGDQTRVRKDRPLSGGNSLGLIRLDRAGVKHYCIQPEHSMAGSGALCRGFFKTLPYA